MHKNYYLFKRQILGLTPLITGSEIESVFTIKKNELTFQLRHNKSEKKSFLRISIQSDLPYILLSHSISGKKPKFYFFEEISSSIIRNMIIEDGNKYAYIYLDDFIIEFWFFGTAANILLKDKDKKLLGSFKRYTTDTVTEKPLNHTFNRDTFEQFYNQNPEIKYNDLIKYFFPAFNRKMIIEVAFRCEQNLLEKVSREQIQLIFQRLKEFNDELENGPIYLYKNDYELNLLLFRSNEYDKEKLDYESYSDLNKAWDIFIFKYENLKEYKHLFSECKNVLEKKFKSLQNTLKKISKAKNLEKLKSEADTKGNLLLTNKHKIPKGQKSVELVNIFSDEQEKITIKLNPKKSTSENAQNYFNKYKNINEKKENLELKERFYEEEIAEIESMLENLNGSDLKHLNKMRQKLISMNLLQQVENSKLLNENLRYSFKRYILAEDWDVYVGKNKENNDLLTFQFANKWDLWLHAQGVSGSHVIIKGKHKDQNIPANIIEKAARLAAANSKAKHSEYVPVIYTQVKYVSKIRKAAAGTVKVKNEKSIFVKPLELN